MNEDTKTPEVISTDITPSEPPKTVGRKKAEAPKIEIPGFFTRSVKGYIGDLRDIIESLEPDVILTDVIPEPNVLKGFRGQMRYMLIGKKGVKRGKMELIFETGFDNFEKAISKYDGKNYELVAKIVEPTKGRKGVIVPSNYLAILVKLE